MRQAIATRTARARIRDWPLDASIGHLVMLDVAMVPTVGQIGGWLKEAYRAGPDDDAPLRRSVRTGAMYPLAATAFIDSGFQVVDRLALLERRLPSASPRRRRSSDAVALRRARRRDMETLAELDQAAFPSGWRNDARSLGDIADATPRSARRFAVDDSTGMPVGFQITGHAGPTGYIQRLAVHPRAWGRGVGRLLLDDALWWLTRRGVDRAMVNTGVDNVRALRLYEAGGFDLLDEQLVVLEHRRPT